MCRAFGYLPDVGGKLGVKKINELYNALDIMESQELMGQIKAARSIHMAEEDFKTLHKYLHKKAYPHEYERHRLENLETLKGQWRTK